MYNHIICDVTTIKVGAGVKAIRCHCNTDVTDQITPCPVLNPGIAWPRPLYNLGISCNEQKNSLIQACTFWECTRFYKVVLIVFTPYICLLIF